ncbi:MAG: sigma-70 family RNA polymerase sigma factor [Methylophilaceae bacterium]
MQHAVTINQTIARDFYLEHNKWLNGWLRKKMSCVFDASDIAQDTMIKVIYHQELTNIEEPRAYLTTTATRLIIDLVRKRNLEAAYVEALSYQQSEVAASPDCISEAIETLNEIAKMLEGLPEKVYRAFLMCRLEGLTYEAIGEQLGVSASMVKQYIAKAMLHCYQVIYEDGAAR